MDFYLLGVLIYEMLLGIPPFYHDNKEILFKKIQKEKLTLPNFLSW